MVMASIASSSSATICPFRRKPILKTLNLAPFSISFPLCRPKLCATKTELSLRWRNRRSQEITAYAADLLRNPVGDEELVKEYSDDDENGKKVGDGDTWVNWEDQILEETTPLVGFVRMILHSGEYENGDRLSPEHEKTILERLLPYHPESENKIGNGVDYIMIGNHPNFESSRCLFIARKDGELVDFSYWKCIKGLIKTKYPLYADNFILRHIRWRKWQRSNPR